MRSRAFFLALILSALSASPLGLNIVARSRPSIVVLDAAGDAKARADIHIISSDVNATTFTVTLGAIRLKSKIIEGQSSDVIAFEGAVPNPETGAPDVPVIRQAFAIPECESVQIEVLDGKSTVLDDVTIGVVPEQLAEGTAGVPLKAEHMRDQEYGVDGGRVVRVGSMRGQNIAIVELNPVRYNPISGVTRVISDMRVTLRTKNARGPQFVSTGPMTDMLGSVLANNPSYGSTPPTRQPQVSPEPGDVCWCDGAAIQDVINEVNACGADYLMIVAEELATPAESRAIVELLAQRRASYNGFNVAIVSMQHIDSTPDNVSTPITIRDLIKGVYEAESAEHMSDHKLGYVLLLGDAKNPSGQWLIPAYYGWTDIVLEGPIEVNSDAYYSLTDTEDPDEDPFPDVLLGRLPVDFDASNTEITNVTDKVLDYEPLPANAAWVDKDVLISGGQPSGFEVLAPGAANPFVTLFDWLEDSTIPTSNTVVKLHRIGSPLGDISYSGAAVDTLKNGARISMLFDHGHYYYLAGEQGGGCFRPNEYELLTTAGPSFMFAPASYLGAFDNTTAAPYGSAVGLDPLDVLAERLVLLPDGAIAVVAYCRTNSTHSGVTDALALFDAVYRDNAPDLGSIITSAKFRSIVNGSNGSMRRLTLFGDPALNIQWRDVAHDDIDVSVGALGITSILLPGGNLPQTGNISIKVENGGSSVVQNLAVEVWDGDPLGDGTLIDDDIVISSIQPRSATTLLVPYSFNSGLHDVYVVLDPNEVLSELSRTNNVAYQTFNVIDYEPGFPCKVNWNSGIRSLLIADMHATLGKELLISGNSRTSCVSAAGTELWSRPAKHAYSIGTVHLDATSNLVSIGYPFAPPYNGFAYLHNPSTGAAIDSFLVGNLFDGTIFSSNLFRGAESVWLGDYLASNATLELLTHEGSGIAMFDFAGNEHWSVDVSGSTPATAADVCVASADVDLDGDVEIAVARADSVVLVNGSNGQTLWRRELVDYNFDAGYLREFMPTLCLADLNGDGPVEVVAIGSVNGDRVARAYDTDGSLLHETELNEFAPSHNVALAAGNLDSAPGVEIAVAADNDLYVLDSNLNIVSTYSAPATASISPTILLADIDGNSSIELLCVTVEKTPLYKGLHELVVLSNALSPISRVRLFQDVSLPINAPAVDDIDNDGVLEFAVFASSDSVLHVFEVGGLGGKVYWGMNHHDAMATRLNEQPIAGTYSEPVSLFNSCRVIDDATFADDVYVDATADIVVNTTSLTSGGYHATKCDLYVNQALDILGNANEPITVRSSTGATSSWGALFVVAGGESAEVRNCSFYDASMALRTDRSILVDNGSFRNSIYGLYITSGTTSVSNSKFIGNTACLVNSGAVTVANSQFQSSSYGVFSLYQTTVQNSTFSGVVTGIALVNTMGLANSSFVGNQFDGSSTACISVAGVTGAVVIRGNEMRESAVGIKADGATIQIRRGNLIEDNTIGIQCVNNAFAVVESTDVHLNGIGVEISANSNADLGVNGGGGQSLGRNAIYENSDYAVKNLNSVTIKAERNWWGGVPSAVLFSGNVDYNPYLSTKPINIGDPSPPTDVTDGIPTKFDLGYAVPNPFNPVTTMSYDVPDPAEHVDITIFDVAGRRVATLVDRVVSPGRHSVQWQGVDSRGVTVASGVYFVRMRSTSFMQTRKIVLLK